ncbi:MAG: glycosyltransferase 87 family protein [Acidobacteriaceae bacterium]
MGVVSEKLDKPQVETGGKSSSPSKKILRALIVAAIALAGAFIFTARVNPARMDYISYWSTARLLVHHGNPYSAAGVFSLEKPLGFLPPQPLMMRNPPWALFLVLPLGFSGPRVGLFLWVIALAACIIGSVHLLNPRSRDNPLALLFAPAIACIGSGQSSPFLLLGFALFLYFHQRRPFLAGAALLLMAIKPHLFLVFWAVLLAESIYRRRFRIIAGAAAALALAAAFATALDPHVWTHYIFMMRASALELETFPTASMLFRFLIDPRAEWLLVIPSAVAVLWGLWYYAHNRQEWSWATHGMLLMLVTVFASPYGWFTDEVVLLPPIIFALNLPEKRKYAGWILLAINAVAAIVYTAAGASLETVFLIWTPIAWLVWFLYATRKVAPTRLSVQLADSTRRSET